MTGVILRKEAREQAAVTAALAALAVLALVAAKSLTRTAEEADRILGLLAVLVCWAFGLVSGAMLLAGEREAGTLAFLDGLPAARRGVWLRKALAGVAATALFTLVAVAVVLAAAPPGDAHIRWMVAAAFAGTAAGLCGSASAETVIGAVGRGVVAQLLALLLAVPLVGQVGDTVAVLTIVAAPAAVSYRRFTAPDRQRRSAGRAARPEPGAETRRRAYRRSVGASARLAWRQARRLWLGMFVAGFVIGVFLPVTGVWLWPPASLVLGVIAGATLLADEREGGAARFLAEQRLPLGRVWGVQAAVRFGAVLAATAAAVAVVAAARSYDATFHAPDLGPRLTGRLHPEIFDSLHYLSIDARPVGRLGFALIGPLHGFAAGALAAVLFRKVVVSLVVALLLGTLALGVWLPSLLLGGLHSWQWLGLPVALLAASRLAVRPWAAGRLGRGLAPLTVAVPAFVGLATVPLGLWYRVAEVPAPMPGFDPEAFEAGRIPPERNEAGRLLERAVERFQTGTMCRLPAGWTAGPREGTDAVWWGVVNEARAAVQSGWGPDNRRLGQALDALAAEEWAADLRRLPSLPDGEAVTLRLKPRRDGGFRDANYGLQMVAQLLAARSLQLRAVGDAAGALDTLGVLYAIARTLRHNGTAPSAQLAAQVRRFADAAFDRCLTDFGPDPALRRRAIDTLLRTDAALPAPGELMLAEYGRLRAESEGPDRASGEDATRSVGLPKSAGALLSVARSLPWERERAARVLRYWASVIWQAHAGRPAGRADAGGAWRSPEGDLLFRPENREAVRLLQNDPVYRSDGWAYPLGVGFRDPPAASARLRAFVLQLALVGYQAREGKAAPSLQALVPGDLAELPPDPYSPGGREPFRYRVTGAQGEAIVTPDLDHPSRDLTVEVPAGCGILWSVGPDGADHEGRTDAGVEAFGWSKDVWVRKRLDWVIVLPPPPAKK